MEAWRPRISEVVETVHERTAEAVGLGHALRALARQAHPPGLTEIIVVDFGALLGLDGPVEQQCLGSPGRLDRTQRVPDEESRCPRC
jgi:hypothetical protein